MCVFSSYFVLLEIIVRTRRKSKADAWMDEGKGIYGACNMEVTSMDPMVRIYIEGVPQACDVADAREDLKTNAKINIHVEIVSDKNHLIGINSRDVCTQTTFL